MRQSRQNGRAVRDVTINLRASGGQRTLIDQAATSLGKSRSDFMLEAACREAQAVLLEQRFFALDADAFARFVAALDAAPAENRRLRRLLAEPAPWES